MDKPTLKEYMKYRGGRFTKTHDGRYYSIKTYPKNFIIMMVLVVLLAAPSIGVMFLDIPWRSEISKDLLILFFILTLLVPAIFYPLERFERIEQGSELYQNAIAQTDRRENRIITIVVVTLVIIVTSLGSFSLIYLRSLLDTPKAECMIYIENSDASIKLYTDKGDTNIAVHGEPSGDVRINLYVWHTPAIAQLKLDEDVRESSDEYQHGRYWFDQNYFWQDYDYTIDAEDIHDGSVLTLTCGKWQYEWVFAVDS